MVMFPELARNTGRADPPSGDRNEIRPAGKVPPPSTLREPFTTRPEAISSLTPSMEASFTSTVRTAILICCPPVTRAVTTYEPGGTPEAEAPVRNGQRYQVIDHLICGSLIEGRSCEKFQILATELASRDRELAEFYAGLVESEGNHYATYLLMAKGIDEAETHRRLDFYLDLDATLIRAEFKTNGTGRYFGSFANGLHLWARNADIEKGPFVRDEALHLDDRAEGTERREREGDEVRKGGRYAVMPAREVVAHLVREEYGHEREAVCEALYEVRGGNGQEKEYDLDRHGI